MNTNKPLNIIVPPQNINEYLTVYRAIRTFTDKDLDVPAMLIKVFFDLMQNSERYKINKLFEEAKTASLKAAEKIRSLKEYQFEWEDTILEDGTVIKNDTAKICLELVHAFFLYKEDYIKSDKDDAIGFFYEALEEYKTKIIPDVKNRFTTYKQAVISGIIAMATGFTLILEPDPSNEKIYQSTRNAIKKFQKD